MSKSWKLFKWLGLKSTKTTSRFVLFVLTTLLVACSSISDEVRTEPFTASKPLKEKAQSFQLLLEKEFLSKEGWLCYSKPRGHRGIYYSNFKRQTSMTALQLLAEVHRYKASENMDAVHNLEKLLGGLELLFAITNSRGYPARAMAPNDEVDIHWKWRGATPQWKLDHPLVKYHWRGDAGKDEFASLILALSESVKYLEDFSNLQERARKLLLDMSWFFLENFQQIRGTNGQLNEHGDLTGEVVVVPIFLELSMGYNHFISMAIYSAAIDHCKDEKLKKRFERGLSDLIKNGALNNLKPVTDHTFGRRNFRHDNMAFMMARVLLDSPSFPYKEEVLRAIHRLWMKVREEKNVFWYTLIKRHINESDEFNNRMQRELKLYPDRKVAEPVDFCKRHETAFFNNRHGEKYAIKAVNLNERPVKSFMWAASPYNCQCHATVPLSFAPVDFLLAYWLGRSEGVVASR